MKKSTFYFICEHIHPEQVQSLVLSDDEHTPYQSKLFTSLLPLIKCINLQSITINQIHDATLLCLMLSHLENHVRIYSLSVDSQSMPMSKKISKSITEALTTLPSLKYLTFMNSSALITLRQPLSKLTHLTIRSCIYNDLQIIFRWVPNLFYLRVSVSYNQHLPIFDYIPPDLSSLIIESKSWALFNQVENLLSLTPSLKRFIFETMGEQALLDARRWETIIKTKLPHLTELALDISPEENNMTGDDVLIPFQNRFWTTEKHWHMACFISTVTQSCARLFSVPHFSPSDNWYPAGEGFFNYSVTGYSFDEGRKDLQIFQFPSEISIPSPFKHIQTLSLECTADNIDQLQKVVNLLPVNHLKFGSSVECTWFHDFLQVAPNISQLTMKRKALVQIMDSLTKDQHVCEQMKILNMKDIILSTDIDQIGQTFPKLEHISLMVKEREDILRIFDKLHYLTSTTVHWSHPYNTPVPVMNEFIEQNNICSDGTYWFHASTLHVWND
jgi:hypothetical protein